jgi:hypothetical protein
MGYGFVGIAQAQGVDRTTLSGYIRDGSTGEAVIGATLVLRSASQGAGAQVYGVYSNDYGFFALSVPPDKYQLAITYLGYKNLEQLVDLTGGNVRLDLQLVPADLSTVTCATWW